MKEIDMDHNQETGEPRFRGRINWGRTKAEGWRLNEITVENSNMTADTLDMGRGHATSLAIDLYQDGCREADRRNEIERLGAAA